MATISTTARPAYVYDAVGDQWVPIAWRVFPAGVGSAPALTFTGDSNTGLWSPAADTVAFSTGGTERMRITSAGNVGIGQTAPTSPLEINTTTQTSLGDVADRQRGAVFLGMPSGGTTGDGNLGPAVAFSGINTSRRRAAISAVQTSSDEDQVGLLFAVHSSATASNDTLGEAMRITHAGNVGIGTNSPAATLHVSGSSPIIQSSSAATASSSGYIYLTKARGSIASPTVVSSGDNINGIYFAAYDGSAYQNAAAITALVDTTPGAGDMPGRLSFSTTADGASSVTERMRIDNAGLITGTGTSLGAWTAFTPTVSGGGTWAIGNGTTAGYYCQIGKIVHFRASITFGTTSVFDASSTILVSAPVASNTTNNIANHMLTALARDVSAGSWYLLGTRPFNSSSTVFGLYTLGTSGLQANVTSSAPFAWASTDVIYYAGTYEIA